MSKEDDEAAKRRKEQQDAHRDFWGSGNPMDDKPLASRSTQRREVAASMDLATAQTILHLVVVTHESTLTPDSNLDQLGTYSSDQVMQAVVTVTSHVVQENRVTPSSQAVFKRVEGVGQFITGFFARTDGERLQHRPVLGFDSDGRGRHIEAEFPVAGAATFAEKWKMGFQDTQDPATKVTVGELERFDLQKYQAAWRGLRWMAANLLFWNTPTFFLPEDLDVPNNPRKLPRK